MITALRPAAEAVTRAFAGPTLSLHRNPEGETIPEPPDKDEAEEHDDDQADGEGKEKAGE